MARDLENELKQRFADLAEELPGADFTSDVKSALLRPRRRARLLWCAAVLAALVFLWFSFPHLEAGVSIVAGLPRTLLDVANESWAPVIHSPLLYIYGIALGCYALLSIAPRLKVRLM
jgi:hypothetical protein